MKKELLIAELDSIPTRIAAAARRAAEYPQPEAEWSLRTIMIHLIAVDILVWNARLRSIVEQDNPHWVWTEPDLAEWERRLESKSLDDLAAEYARTRGEIVSHLNGLDEAGWARIGTHAAYGQMDVAGLCARALEHDYEHLADLHKRGGQ